MSLEHLWAGWRREYIVTATERARAGGTADDDTDCVFCRLAASGKPSEDNLVVWRGEHASGRNHLPFLLTLLAVAAPD